MSKYLRGLYRAGMKYSSYFLVPAIIPKNLMISNHIVFILILEYYMHGIF
jgi:hypothetical protein